MAKRRASSASSVEGANTLGDATLDAFALSPPKWIDMRSADTIRMSVANVTHWTSEAGGRAAARRGEEMNYLRLMGSLQLSFTVPSVTDTDLAEMLGLTEKPVKPRQSHAKWYRARGCVHAHGAPPLETWHATTGEIPGQGFLSPAQLLQATFGGSVLCDQDWGTEILEAIGLLTTPDQALWGCPLLRAIIVPPASLHAAVGSYGAKAKKPKAKQASPATASHTGALSLSVHVYVSRLLLYLIAHPSIRVLLSRLSASSVVVKPLDSLPSYPQCFQSHGGAGATPFSLEGVLKSCEHKGYREAAQPRGVALPLKRYQTQALQWMQDMEALPRGINGLFWEVSLACSRAPCRPRDVLTTTPRVCTVGQERAFADGGTYFYSPQLGEVRLASPSAPG